MGSPAAMHCTHAADVSRALGHRRHSAASAETSSAGSSRSSAYPVLMTRSAGGVLDGLGAWFAQRITTAAVAFATGSAVVIVLGAAWLAASAGWVVTVAAGGAGVLGALVGSAIIARRGGLDGDGMGAIVELSVLAGLASAALAAV